MRGRAEAAGRQAGRRSGPMPRKPVHTGLMAGPAPRTGALRSKTKRRPPDGRAPHSPAYAAGFLDVLGDQLGHLEHADFFLAAEDSPRGGICVDPGLRFRILQFILLEVNSELLGELRAGATGSRRPPQRASRRGFRLVQPPSRRGLADKARGRPEVKSWRAQPARSTLR